MKRVLAFFLISAGLIFSCAPRTLHLKGTESAVTVVEPEVLDIAYAPRKIALLVGINRFDDELWRPLLYAEKDARDFGELLKNPQKGGFNDMTVLTGRDMTRRAVIIEAIRELSDRNTNPQDIVVVYFSTHGTLDREATGDLKQYLVTSDTRFDDIPGTALDIQELRFIFGNLRSRRKVLILATCHSGQGKSELNSKIAAELRGTKSGFFVKPLESVSEASVVLSACAWGETAREDDRLEHDIYTHFLIEALRKFDPNDDGAVTVSEAHDYAREKTYYYTEGRQRATAMSDILGSDPIVLVGTVKRPGKPIIYSYDGRMKGVEVRVDGVPKGKLPGCVVIEPGKCRVALIKPGENEPFFNRPIMFEQGSRMDAVNMVQKKYYEDQTLGVGVSYRAFISTDISKSIYGPMITYGMTYGQKAPWRRTRWEFGIFAGNESQTLEINDIDRNFTLTRLDLEADLLWEYRLGRFQLASGPMAGILFFQRRFEEGFTNSPQEQVTAAIGAVLAIKILATKKWRPELTYRAAVVPIDLDDEILTGWHHSAGFNVNYLF